MNKKKGNEIYNDNIWRAKTFDAFWRSRFDNLGTTDLPAYLKASYHDRVFFEYREIFLRHLFKELLSFVRSSSKAKNRCLDVGCNDGLYTKMLYDSDSAVYGIDYSNSLIREASIKYPEIAFCQANAYDLPYKNCSFDCVVAFGVIQCVADWQKVIREVIRVMKPEGIAVVETIKVFPFPFLEKMLRNVTYLLMGKMNFSQAIKKVSQQSKSISTSYAPRKIPIKDILEFLIDLDVADITIHNPTKFYNCNTSFCGFTFFKGSNKNTTLSPTTIKECTSCQKSK